MKERPLPSESLVAAFLSAMVLAVFAPIWLAGRTPFWGDMTYIHHPWQATLAQTLQAGRMPLWDPSLYLGMPLAAKMQNSVFYPGQVPFFLFGFATAAALFHGLHYWLAGWLSYLWLRSLRLSRGACLSGAAAYCLAGVMVSHMPFINHLSTLSLAPGLLLFFRRPLWLGTTLALAFCAGYPPFLIGAAALSWAVMAVLASPAGPWGRFGACCAGNWLAAGLLAGVLAACQLIPGAEFMVISRRSGGMTLDETLRFGYSFRDLAQWVSPLLVGWRRFDPAVEWWKCSYLGFAGFLAAAWGLWRLAGRRRAGLAAILLGIAVVVMGDAAALSRAVWEHFPPLRFVRYPGNLAYLAVPCASLLVAAGVSRLPGPWRPFWALALAGELIFYAWGSAPQAPRGLFTDAGPLVRYLQENIGEGRYLLSPLALESHSGAGVLDWKHRLYGMTNGPFRLRAVGNFGEPLVPRENYELMDFLYRQPSAEAAARFLPWLGTRFLLTRDKARETPLLDYEGRILWHVYKVRGPVSLAWLLDERAGAALPAGLPEGPPSHGKPLDLSRGREDRFDVRGDARGWAFIAEPRYPGWKAVLETPAGTVAVSPSPALGPFQKVQVPDGPWRLRFFFDPLSWRLGRFITVLALMGLGLYVYHRKLLSV